MDVYPVNEAHRLTKLTKRLKEQNRKLRQELRLTQAALACSQNYIDRSVGDTDATQRSKEAYEVYTTSLDVLEKFVTKTYPKRKKK